MNLTTSTLIQNLVLGSSLPKTTLGRKLPGLWVRGALQKIWTPYLFSQLLKQQKILFISHINSRSNQPTSYTVLSFSQFDGLIFYGIMVLGMFLTVVGRRVLGLCHFSFIVTACRYLINYMKDSCCFIDDYCSVIILSCAL